MRRAALLVLSIAAATPRPARAGDPEVDGLLEQARRDKAALRYREGLAVLDRALRLGRSGPPELIAIHRLAGELAAGVDDPAAATAHFRRLLALAPATTLPPGTSPKLTGPFDAAAADIRARGPLRVRFVDHRGGRRRLEIIIDGDPAGQVAAARLEVRTPPLAGPRALHAEPTAGRVDFPLPAGTLHLVARVVDRHGNTLAERAIQDPASASHPGGAAPLYARWWPWAAASVLLAGGATWAGLEALDAQSQLDDIAGSQGTTSWDQTRAIERRGRRAALLANLSFGAAAATAVLSTYLLVRERRTSAVITTTGDTVAVSFTARF